MIDSLFIDDHIFNRDDILSAYIEEEKNYPLDNRESHSYWEDPTDVHCRLIIKTKNGQEFSWWFPQKEAEIELKTINDFINFRPKSAYDYDVEWIAL